jgi:tRNA pseudouridine38-40 synthase
MLTSLPTGFRYFIELAFNGSPYHGWQIQPGAISVQETLNNAITILVGEPVNVVGCGRTDAGVHASHFVAHFDVVDSIQDCDAFAKRLNRFLNDSIRIDRIVRTQDDFHARFNALARTYHYLISREKAPYMGDFAWRYTLPLNIQSMAEASEILVGKYDFTSFSKLHTDVKTNICEVREAVWYEFPGYLVFKITADRFLRNMVRSIVGTLIEVGKGKRHPYEMVTLLDQKNRSKAGISVPAKGLFLTKVDYDPLIFKVAPKPPFFDWS